MLQMVVLVGILVALGVYLSKLIEWWAVLDDPEHFVRHDLAENAWHRELKAINAAGKMNEAARL